MSQCICNVLVNANKSVFFFLLLCVCVDDIENYIVRIEFPISSSAYQNGKHETYYVFGMRFIQSAYANASSNVW